MSIGITHPKGGLPPPQWVTKCSGTSIFSAFYLFMSLHVTETSARGYPWRSACCLPAGGAAPWLCRTVCPASCGLWRGAGLVRPGTISQFSFPGTGSLYYLWIPTCFVNSHSNHFMVAVEIPKCAAWERQVESCSVAQCTWRASNTTWKKWKHFLPIPHVPSEPPWQQKQCIRT